MTDTTTVTQTTEMRPDQKRALTDLRCATRKLAEWFRANGQEVAAAALETAAVDTSALVKSMREA
jgi:hypothetical protein